MYMVIRGRWEIEGGRRGGGRGNRLFTGVVDESVDMSWVGLDLLESLLNGVVAGQIDLEGFNGVGHFGAFFVESVDRESCIL